ncbi:hypothetical protein PHAVU_001G147900 [Phaseolus vulgaris]|uniref:Uncharacterized protein n=1 Tax=Phaseolus vulgaris TaxID=3885 RepID=V7CW29_PHAVU|nr:hypothetical protein PHAVU_001G147900g [Phaseolus vulgaris]ESW34382.1 hypothetical protein PHAVU_001G147900g [Phaseolus vulgaris]
MENNNNSRSSICWKIRHALATNLAFKAIHRIKHYCREPRTVTTHENSSSLPLSTNFSQNRKAKDRQGEGTIPIKFDNSIPTSTPMLLAYPQVGTSQVAAKVEPEPRYVRGSRVGVSKGEDNGKDGTGPLKEQRMQQGKKTLDINDTFSEYIERARHRIRTVSNVGRGQNKSAPVEDSGNNNKIENHKDHFADFIQHAKKMRATSSVGKTSSLRRGYNKS